MFITKVNGINVEKRELVERDCTSRDLDMLVAFQKRVKSCMKIRNNWTIYKTKDLKEILEKDDFIKLYYDNDTFVGFSILRVNHGLDFEEKLGVDSIPSDKTALVIGAMIDPKYWGNKLQNQMLTRRKEIAREKGLRYMLSMVSPNNGHSYDNLVDANYKTIVDDQFEGGRRLILTKELR